MAAALLLCILYIKNQRLTNHGHIAPQCPTNRPPYAPHSYRSAPSDSTDKSALTPRDISHTLLEEAFSGSANLQSVMCPQSGCASALLSHGLRIRFVVRSPDAM